MKSILTGYLQYFSTYPAFFDKGVQDVLRTFPKDASPGEVIEAFFATAELAAMHDPYGSTERFAKRFPTDRTFYAELLLALARYHERPDAKRTQEEIVMDELGHLRCGGMNWKEHFANGVNLRPTPPAKWDSIAQYLWNDYKLKATGDTLRTSLFPHYVKNRLRVLSEWQTEIEAYLRRHINPC